MTQTTHTDTTRLTCYAIAEAALCRAKPCSLLPIAIFEQDQLPAPTAPENDGDTVANVQLSDGACKIAALIVKFILDD